MKKIQTLILIVLFPMVLSGCDLLVQEMRPTELGVTFSKLPPFLGGGIKEDIVPQGQYVFLWPWESLYRFDTSIQYISWGGSKRNTGSDEDFVYTRAADGNEVALALTVQYQVAAEKDKLRHLLQYVSTDVEGVRNLVQVVARAHIRTYMNELKTSEFFNRNARYAAILKAQEAMNERLSPEGISIVKVILDEHRFERLLPDGTIDRNYQEKIDETQKLGQDRERELLRIETVRAQKRQELNETQAKVNREVAEAQGYLEQYKSRGQSYYEARKNEADGILARGKADVEGLVEKIKAFNGPGGEAMLKLEMVKQMLSKNPRFVVMGGGSESAKNGIDVRKIDANELLNQIGITEALKDKPNLEKVVPSTAQ
jgi:hypothetical protein